MLVKFYVSLAAAAFLMASSTNRSWSADTYVVDAVHAYVGFSVSHLVINRVRGTFNEFSGTIIYDADDITNSSMSGTISVASVDTAQEKRDRHLRSADFFDAAAYPHITFETTRIEAEGDFPVLHGRLTMRGVSREVAIPFRITGIVESGGETRLGFEARLELNRQDYGVSYSRLMDSGGLVVGNRVSIELNGVAIKVADG